MNRPRWIAAFLLLASPTAGLAQQARPAQQPQQIYLDDFLRALPRSGTTNPNARENLDATIDFTFYRDAGWRAIGKGYLDTAEHEFLSAIKAARKQVPVDNRLVARGYADYAWALQQQKRYAEAEPILKWVLAVREASFPPDALPIAQTRNQLSTLYSETGRPAEAEPLLLRAVAAHEKAARASSTELARSQCLLGLLMVAQKRYAEAESPFLKAVRLQEKARGSYHPETGDALNNLARTYQEQRKFDQARPVFERALAIFEQSRGPTDSSVALILDPLAKIDENRGDLEEAEAKYRRALGIWEGYAPTGEASRVEVAGHLADFLEKQGRPDEARKLRVRPSAPRPAATSPARGPIAPPGNGQSPRDGR